MKNGQNWHKLMKDAYIVAQTSTNISTQNGAVLVDRGDNIILSATNLANTSGFFLIGDWFWQNEKVI